MPDSIAVAAAVAAVRKAERARDDAELQLAACRDALDRALAEAGWVRLVGLLNPSTPIYARGDQTRSLPQVLTEVAA